MAEYATVDKEWLEAGLTDVSDSIRGLIESEEKLEFPQGMKEAIESYSLDEPLEAQDALIEQIKTALQGKASSGESEFGESYWIENLENKTTFDYLFYNWTSEKIPYCDTSKITSCSQMCMYSKITEFPPYDLSNCKNSYSMFNGARSLVTVPKLNLAKCTNASAMFSNCVLLREVEIENTGNITNFSSFINACNELVSVKTLDLSSASGTNSTIYMFNGCYKLENVLFVSGTIKKSISFQHSSLLSDASIQSIIDGLADLTGLDTQTLTLHADVKTKLTEDQITTITSKNWTLA